MSATARPPAESASPAPYRRIDWAEMESGRAAAPGDAAALRPRVRWMIIPLSVVLCAAQAVITILAENVQKVMVTSTMISVIAFAVLVGLVVGVNPLLGMKRLKLAAVVLGVALVGVPLWLMRAHGGGMWQAVTDAWVCALVAALVILSLRMVGVRPLSRAELMSVFAALLVTAGISTFGLTSQLVPLLPAPHNPQWNTPQRGWGATIEPHLRSELYVHDRQAIEDFYRGISRDRAGNRLTARDADAPWGERLTYYGRVFDAVPWATWIAPLSYWLILIAGAYGLFYSLTYVVLPHWRDREKLIFPLARLPESLLPDDGEPGRVPAVFRSPLFWLGFGLSAGVLLWNGLAVNAVIDPSFRIPLGMSRNAVDAAIRMTIWEGLGSSPFFPLTFLIVFTAIGIAFLLPLEISSSMWGYYLAGKALILVAVWLGFGRVAGDFPSNWLWFNNPVTAQGGGGLFFFAAISLWRCLKDYAHLIRGRSAGEALRLAMPVIGLVLSLVVMTWWLQWNRIGWFWAAVLTLTLTLLTVGLMRIVAEGGVYWFQSHTSFFHIYKMFGLGKFLPAPLMAPLIPIYSVLFLDIKTFMAPNLLNAAAMQRDVRGDRFKFHLNIVMSVAATVVLSLGLALFLAHLWGAQTMNGWFYVQGPSGTLDTARDASRGVSELNPVNTAWWGFGAAWVAISMYLRTRIFWFPHPIGYIMLINPLMSQLWFSFFIGWACKKFAVKYGGKATFDKVRGAFIGLIVGELMMIVLWLALSLLYPGVRSTGMDLNRYFP